MGIINKLKKTKTALKYIHDDLPIEIKSIKEDIDNTRILLLNTLSELHELYNNDSFLLKDINQQLKDNLNVIENKSTNLEQKIEKVIDEANVNSNLLNDINYYSASINNRVSGNDFFNPEISSLNLIKREGKKNVLLVGFYGAYNFGDEIMLQTLLQYLNNKKDIHITIMLAENDSYDSYVHGDVSIIHYCRTYSDFSFLADYFDVLIVGGGALLDDEQFEKKNQGFISLATIVAKLPLYFNMKGKESYLIGLSTNESLNNKSYLQNLNEVIKTSKHFSVRDGNSLKTLESAGIDISNIRQINDIALSNKQWLTYKLEKKEAKDKKTIGITWFNMKEYQEKLISIINDICNNIDKVEIVLIPMYDIQQTDNKYYEEVLLSVDEKFIKNISIAHYPKTLEESLHIFNSLDLIINMRYHSSLISANINLSQIVLLCEEHRHYKNKMDWLKMEYPDTVELLSIYSDNAKIIDSVIDLLNDDDKSINSNDKKENIKILESILNDI